MDNEEEIKWNYIEITGSHPDDVLADANTFINTVKPQIVKICVSDIKKDVSRAVVFYKDTLPAITLQSSCRTEWIMKTKKTDTNYSAMYHEIAKELDQLDEFEEVYASVSFTNAKASDSHMAIYYPKSK